MRPRSKIDKNGIKSDSKYPLTERVTLSSAEHIRSSVMVEKGPGYIPLIGPYAANNRRPTSYYFANSLHVPFPGYGVEKMELVMAIKDRSYLLPSNATSLH